MPNANTTPLSSHATMLAVQETPGGVFTDIGELGDLALPELMRNEFDASVQNKNIDAWVLGILRRGSMTFPVHYIPTEGTHDQTTGLIALMKANTITGFKVTFPDSGATTWVMSGQVQKFGPVSAKVDGKLEAPVTLRFTGAMTIGAVTFS